MRRNAVVPRRFLVTALLMLLATGCAGNQSADVPEGFVLHQGEDFPYAFAYPQDWRFGSGPDEDIKAVGEVNDQGIPEGAFLNIDTLFEGDFDEAIDGLNTLAAAQYEGLETLSDEEVSVPGAARARLITSTYSGPSQENPDVTVDLRQLELFAIPEDEEPLYYFRVNGPEELFDEEQARQIIDSFALTG